MKYDFTKIIDRRNSDASAVDERAYPIAIQDGEKAKIKDGFDVISMWIADMNFETAPSVTKALEERIKHPLYGYYVISDEFYDSIISRFKTENNISYIKKENIGYENGVLGGLSSILDVLCSKGDNILINSPCYIGFLHVLKSNGYNIITSPLVLDENEIYRFDYIDLEKKIIENHIHVFILCNPHNPTGRSWRKEELTKLYEILKKHDVYVISDEIWSDLILFDNKHVCAFDINEDAKMRTISLFAPSKTFNLAGLIGAYHIIFNETLLDRINKEEDNTNYNKMSVLSMHALIGAYSDNGKEWKKELVEVLSSNANYAYNYIKTNFKGVNISKPEATYLLYLDCKDYLKENNLTIKELEKEGYEVGVIWEDGEQFLKENTIRMNIALPFVKLKEALERLNKYVFNKKRN